MFSIFSSGHCHCSADWPHAHASRYALGEPGHRFKALYVSVCGFVCKCIRYDSLEVAFETELSQLLQNLEDAAKAEVTAGLELLVDDQLKDSATAKFVSLAQGSSYQVHPFFAHVSMWMLAKLNLCAAP